MCSLNDIEKYTDEWEDYFTYVNTHVLRNLGFEDELYIAYGSYLGLPVYHLAEWFEAAEANLIGTDLALERYVNAKYGDMMVANGDYDWFVDRLIADGMVFENSGYWFEG